MAIMKSCLLDRLGMESGVRCESLLWDSHQGGGDGEGEAGALLWASFSGCSYSIGPSELLSRNPIQKFP